VSWENLLVGTIVAVSCAALAWPVGRWRLAVPALTCGVCGAVMVAGVATGLPFYPLSDVVVLAFAVSGGVLLGRAMRTGVVPFLLLLLVLSVLDVAMSALLSDGRPPPAGAPAPSAARDPHLIWVNFRVPLPTGRFNIGFGDLVLIAAMSVHLRARGAGHVVAASAGPIGLALVLTLVSLPGWQQVPLASPLSMSLIPFLTAGWLSALAASRIGAVTPTRTNT
jgi:hypothetical protein